MASNKYKSILKEPTIGLYEEVEPRGPMKRAEELFDNIIGNPTKKADNYSNYANRRRVPLAMISTINANLSTKQNALDSSFEDNSQLDNDFEPSAKTSKTRLKRIEDKRINRVKFADNSVKRVNKKRENKKNVSKKCRDYPDCTKESLLRAFESAGLPDYDSIAKFELNIISADKCPKAAKPPTPPIQDILRPFEDLIDWSKVDNSSDESRTDVLAEDMPSMSTSSQHQSKPNRKTSDLQQNQCFDANMDSIQTQIVKSVSNRRTDRIKSKLDSSHDMILTAGVGGARIASTPVSRRHNVTLNKNVSPIESIGSPDIDSEAKRIEVIESDNTFVAPLPFVCRKSRKGRKVSENKGISRLEIVRPSISELQKVTLGENRLAQISRSLIDAPKPCIECESSDNESQTLVESTEINVETSIRSSDKNTLSHNSISSVPDQPSGPHSLHAIRNKTFKTKNWNDLSNISSVFAPTSKSTPLVMSRRQELKHSTFDLVVDRTHFDASMAKMCRSKSMSKVNELPIKTTTIVPVFDSEKSIKSTKQSKSKQNIYHLYRKSIASVHSIYKKTSQPFRTVVRTSSAVGLNSFVDINQTIKTGFSNKKELKQCIDCSLSATMFSMSKVVFENGTQTVLSAKQKVLLLCEPNEVIDFKNAFENCVLKKCRKIGEGSYGEVFASKDSTGRDVVIKIIPLIQTNNTTEDDLFAQILPELVISESINRLKNEFQSNRAQNFIDLMKGSITRGLFPSKLVDEWDLFAQRRGTENEDPRTYTQHQLYVVLELANGGTDLESFNFKSALESLSVFAQLSLSLAAAEAEYEFEHRDMHWGNVLINKTTQTLLNYRIKGIDYNLNPNGMFASLIDFSLSRMTSEGFTIFDDLAKYSDLFEGSGDYQFEVYRMMKDLNANDWQHFAPKTNIFWLHYVLDKVIKSKKYSSNRTKSHKNAFDLLKRISNTVLHFDSAIHLVESLDFRQYLEHLSG